MIEKHPIDFEKLAKGTWLDDAELERALNVPRDSTRWRFRLRALLSLIFDQTGIRACEVNGRVRLMTDEEHAAYTRRHFFQHFRGQLRELRARRKIDREQLAGGEAARFESDERAMASMVLAQRSALRKQKALERTREAARIG